MNDQQTHQTEIIEERAPAPRNRYCEHMRADITHYTPGDEVEVVQFRRAMYGSQAIVADAAYLHWLYDDPERVAAAQTAYWLYRKGGQLHAQQGGIRTGLRVGTQEHDALWLVDLMVNAKLHVRGVGPLLTQMACDAADVALRLEAGDAAGKALPDNWFSVGSVPLYVLPLDRPAVRRQRGWRDAWAGLGQAAIASKLWNKAASTKTTGDLRMEHVAQFDERVDALWAHASPHYPVLCRRDQAYLNWRWARCPVGERYQRCIVAQGDRTLGYAVLRVSEHDGLHAGYVVDFLCAPNDTKALVAQCVQELREQDAQIVYCLHTSGHASRTFTALGFVRRQRQWSLMVHACNLAPQQVALVRDQRNWFITAGDGDADRLYDVPAGVGDGEDANHGSLN